MSEREPYSRVYWAIHGDPKFAGMTYAVKGVWVDLLLIGDQAWPASAHLPMGVPKAAVADLEQRGLIVLEAGHLFRIKGLDKERGRRSEAAKAGASARWSQTERNADADRTDTERTPNGMPRRDETRHTETRQAEPPRRMNGFDAERRRQAGFEIDHESGAHAIPDPECPRCQRLAVSLS